jgi:hypothetical protein
VTTSQDFRKEFDSGNYNQALKIALANLIELKITTVVVSSETDSSTPTPELQSGDRLCTRINLVDGEIINEIGSRFLNDGSYAGLQELHLSQAQQGHEIIYRNLQVLDQLFKTLATERQAPSILTPSPLPSLETSPSLSAIAPPVESHPAASSPATPPSTPVSDPLGPDPTTLLKQVSTQLSAEPSYSDTAADSHPPVVHEVVHDNDPHSPTLHEDVVVAVPFHDPLGPDPAALLKQVSTQLNQEASPPSDVLHFDEVADPFSELAADPFSELMDVHPPEAADPFSELMDVHAPVDEEQFSANQVHSPDVVTPSPTEESDRSQPISSVTDLLSTSDFPDLDALESDLAIASPTATSEEHSSQVDESVPDLSLSALSDSALPDAALPNLDELTLADFSGSIDADQTSGIDTTDLDSTSIDPDIDAIDPQLSSLFSPAEVSSSPSEPVMSNEPVAQHSSANDAAVIDDSLAADLDALMADTTNTLEDPSEEPQANTDPDSSLELDLDQLLPHPVTEASENPESDTDLQDDLDAWLSLEELETDPTSVTPESQLGEFPDVSAAPFTDEASAVESVTAIESDMFAAIPVEAHMAEQPADTLFEEAFGESAETTNAEDELAALFDLTSDPDLDDLNPFQDFSLEQGNQDPFQSSQSSNSLFESSSSAEADEEAKAPPAEHPFSNTFPPPPPPFRPKDPKDT